MYNLKHRTCNTLVYKLITGDKMVSKKGERYKCEECGMVVVVEEECGCEDCAIVCCERPMKKEE